MRSILLVLLTLLATQSTIFAKDNFSNKLSEVFKKSEAIRPTVKQARIRNDLPASVDGHLKQMLPAYTATEIETQDLDTSKRATGFNHLFSFKYKFKAPTFSFKGLLPKKVDSKDCKSKKDKNCIEKCKDKDIEECLKKCPSFKKQCATKIKKECSSKKEKLCATKIKKECSSKKEKLCATKIKKECSSKKEKLCASKSKKKCSVEEKKQCDSKSKKECSSKNKSDSKLAPKNIFKNLFSKIKGDSLSEEKKDHSNKTKAAPIEKAPNKIINNIKSFFKVK